MLATAAESIRIITALAYPILPESAAKVWRQLGLGEIQDASKQAFLTNLAWGGLKPGTKFNEPAPLFPRAEKDATERMQNLEDENSASAVEAAGGPEAAPKSAPEAPMSAFECVSSASAASARGDSPILPRLLQLFRLHFRQPVPRCHRTHLNPPQFLPHHCQPLPQVPPKAQSASPQVDQSIDDFAKVELRVAQILVAERIPKADKLLRLEVDLGYEKRQILAGIAQYYEPEKLIGRKIVIVANLAPRKMRGLESNGMLLAASLPDGAPVLAGFLEEVPLGARLKVALESARRPQFC